MDAPTALDKFAASTDHSIELTSNDGALQGFICLLDTSNASAHASIAPTLPLLTLASICSDVTDDVPSLLAIFTLLCPDEPTKPAQTEVHTGQLEQKDLDWLRNRAPLFGSDPLRAGLISKEQGESRTRWVRAISGVLASAYDAMQTELKSQSPGEGWPEQQSCSSERLVGSADGHTGDTPKETAISARWNTKKTRDDRSNAKGLEMDVKVYFDTEGIF